MAKSTDLLAQVLRDFLSAASAPAPAPKKGAIKNAGRSPKTPCPDCGEYPCECDDEDEESPLGPLGKLPLPMKGGRRVTISILMPSKGMMKKRLNGK